MKKALFILGVLILFFGLYLSFWPVPIKPVPWQAPQNAGYTGPFAANNKLADLERLDIGENHGPEDVVATGGYLYTTSQNGNIIRIDENSLTPEVIANTGGVPLGIEADAQGNLIIADAHKGLVSVTPGGDVSILTDQVDGTPILYADDLDIAPDGVIYFSDASTKFGAKASGSTMSGSLLEIIEHGATGRLLAYDPKNSSTRIVKDGFTFANGVAMDGEDILVLETGTYQLHRITKDGTAQVIMDNLPGFPDNINRGPKDTFFVGLISQRSDWLDANSSRPKTRAMAMRLPASLRPQAQNYVHILQIDRNGTVLQSLQDPSGAYPQATGAIYHKGYLYVSSLHAPKLARKKMELKK